jgi:hypothetical protein
MPRQTEQRHFAGRTRSCVHTCVCNWSATGMREVIQFGVEAPESCGSGIRKRQRSLPESGIGFLVIRGLRVRVPQSALEKLLIGF